MTPAGRPASYRSSAIIITEEGSRSEGLSTKVLPQAMATGYIQRGTIAGKLNGVMPAQTPSGWRSDQESISGPTFLENSPLSICGMPQQNSTTSLPRCTSPSASACVLPCSREMARAMSSACRPSSSLKRNMTAARFIGGSRAQSGSAAFAAATASPTSSTLDRPSSPIASPVAGSYTLCVRPLRLSRRSPPMRLSIMRYGRRGWWRVACRGTSPAG